MARANCNLCGRFVQEIAKAIRVWTAHVCTRTHGAILHEIVKDLWKILEIWQDFLRILEIFENKDP